MGENHYFRARAVWSVENFLASKIKERGVYHFVARDDFYRFLWTECYH